MTDFQKEISINGTSKPKTPSLTIPNPSAGSYNTSSNLRRGTCECDSTVSQRDTYGLDIKTCPNCYKLIKMVVV